VYSVVPPFDGEGDGDGEADASAVALAWAEGLETAADVEGDDPQATDRSPTSSAKNEDQ